MSNNTERPEGTSREKKLTGLRFPTTQLIALFFLFSFSGNVPHPFVTCEKHDMLYWAELLVSHVNEQNTSYRHKEISVQWAEINGASTYESFADCSGFINALLKQAYSLDEKYFKGWLGKLRPLAYNYYDAIELENQFTVIQNINDIQAGDLIAIKYNDRSEHDDNTGHLLLVAEKPQHRKSTALIEPGMEQYEITIIDESKSPHGNTDSRYTGDGTPYSGLGKGIFRLYADYKGEIKGYSWSIEKPKINFDPFSNPIIIGRLRI